MLVCLLLSLGFAYSVHGQASSPPKKIGSLELRCFFAVIIRWNSTLISESPSNRDDRVLIYYDDIDVRTSASGGVPDGPGVLVCRHSGRGHVVWFGPNNDTPVQSNNDGDFRIIENRDHTGQDSGLPISRVQLARTRSISQDIASNEGLWACNSGDLPPLHVAIYGRGNGAIAASVVTMQSSSFDSSPPTFTLVGDTTGGPPTSFMWLRNGDILENNTQYNISTQANPNNTRNGRANAHYSSTLTVTGILPGVYEYTASNQATTGDRRDSVIIEGGAPTNMMIKLIGNSTVQVSWTPPENPPSGGYHIVDEVNGLDIPVQSSPQELVLPPGDYSIQVICISLHFSGSVGPQAVTVLGALQPIITSVLQPIPTIVILSWTQPLLSLRPHYYQLTLTQITESHQNCCRDLIDSRSERVVGGSGSFTNLKDFSVYRIRVTANFRIGGNSFSTFVETEISTGKADTTGRDIGISVTVTFLLTTAGCAVVVAVGYALHSYRFHQKKEITPADMRKNVAYAEHKIGGGAVSDVAASNNDTLYDSVNC